MYTRVQQDPNPPSSARQTTITIHYFNQRKLL